MLAKAEKARQRAALEHVVVALEPTSHYWMLIAKDLEDRGVDYLVVHPISVWKGREIRDYSYAKDDFRDASLIAELAAELHFTQARLRDGLWQTMRSLTYERFGLVELRSRALQETGAHLEVIFPNYPVFHRLSLASRAVLCGDPDPERIATLSFDEFVEETRKLYEGSRLNKSTLKRTCAPLIADPSCARPPVRCTLGGHDSAPLEGQHRALAAWAQRAVTTRQLPGRYMALGVNRRNSMAVELRL